MYLASSGIPAVLNVAGVFLFIRIFGEGGYGQYAVVAAIALLSGGVGSTWMVQSILRYHSGSLNREPAGVHVVRYGAAAGSLIIGAVLIGILWYRGESLLSVLAAVVISLALMQYNVRYALRQAARRPLTILASEVSRGVMALGIPLLLVFSGVASGFEAILVGIACGNVAGATVLGRLPQPDTDGAVDWRPEAKRFLSYGIPLSIWMAFATLLTVADRFFIEYFLASEDVGVYVAMHDIAFKATALLLTPILLAAHPMIMGAWNEGRQDLARKHIASGIRMALGVALLAALAWWFLADFASRLILGSENAAAAAIAVPLCVAAGLWNVAVLLHKPLELRKRTGQLVLLIACALAVQAALNMVLIPRMGIEGAPYALLGGIIAYLVLVVTAVWMGTGGGDELPVRQEPLSSKSL